MVRSHTLIMHTRMQANLLTMIETSSADEKRSNRLSRKVAASKELTSPAAWKVTLTTDL